MKKYEYITRSIKCKKGMIKPTSIDPDELDQMLNELGSQGFRVINSFTCGITSTPTIYYTFERETDHGAK